MIRLAAVLLLMTAAPANADDPFWRSAPGVEGALPPALLVPSIPIPDDTCEQVVWMGHWETEYGPVEIVSVEGGKVEGRYEYLNGILVGTLDETGCVMTGRWSQDPTHSEPGDVGTFKFVFDKDGGDWSGTWTFDADTQFVGNWSGSRSAGIQA